MSELPKFPWTSVYLTSLLPLELEGVSETAQPKQLQDRILYAVYYGPKVSVTGTIPENKEPEEVQCPETIARKEEQPMR